MGFITFGVIVYIVKAARSRFLQGSTRLKGSILEAEQETDHGSHTNMSERKDKPERLQERNFDTRWADGLRGVASVGVVSSHICLSFWQQLITPTTNGTDGPPMLFQRPILRLVVQGQAFVALFFILMGFVNSLKPLRQAQANQFEDALLTLARSALTRSARLVLPGAVITVLAWAACQAGLNEIARRSDAYWLLHTSRAPVAGVRVSLTALRDALVDCWVNGENPYDQPQWALKWLLIGSFWIFCALLMTVTTRPLFRMCALGTLYAYSWISSDYIVGTNIYFGIFLAQMHTILSSSDCPSLFRRPSSTITHIIPFVTAIVGLWFMSYPSAFAQDAAWSRDLAVWAARIAPARADVPHFWTAFGAQLLCLSIFCSPILQRLFSQRILCYLGSVSFSLYLLHGPLMRSVLAMLVFGPAALREELSTGGDGTMRYLLPAKWTLLFTIPLWATILMACVHAWSKRVEPIFASVTRVMEEFATGGNTRDGSRSPLQAAIKSSKRSEVQK